MWSYRINVWWDYVLREWEIEDQWKFWSMTVKEFDTIVIGKRKRYRKQLEDTAMFLRHLIANIPMRGKRAKVPKVEELIGMSHEQLVELERLRRKAEKARQRQIAEREARRQT